MQVNPVATNYAPVSQTQSQLPWFQQFRLLLSLLITDYRSAAPFLVLIGLALPTGFLWILRSYVGTGEEALWLLAGNIVMSVCFGSVSFAIQRTALMKVEGELDYYASLSVKKTAFIAATFVESIIFAIPALTSSLVLGYFLLDIPAQKLVMCIPLALLAASSLTIVGSTIGSYAKTMAHFAVLSYLPYLLVIFFSPVLLPYEMLPFFMKVTSFLFPTGQAALVLSGVLHQQYDTTFWILIGALCLWLIIAISIALRKLDWREN
ncbi:ABC transporter permease [Brevibacillus composti]|uniref:ABC transporter permease n=1 Tax=Brevibacillus composti TaxID=2796470 RepID=A0A7T5JM01_9BACL|nr:ABC transporter permease [Brevibacillus composti]QQE72808.1 ABC transporter permease [Brevibacillus composti]QUO39886.1 ABC transporter permease [Brevibacillus composti]